MLVGEFVEGAGQPGFRGFVDEVVVVVVVVRGGGVRR